MELKLSKPGQFNIDLLKAEMDAAIPQADGFRVDEGSLYLILPDEDETGVENLRGLAEMVLRAHDPAGLTTEQQRAARAGTALEELSAANYAAWVKAVKNAGTLALLKPLVLQLGRIVWLLLQAQGLTDTAELEG